jgi:phosphoribosylglycinamide formyltransferase-1
LTGPRQSIRAAILISGSGTNLQAFIDAVADGTLDMELAVVLSNKEEAYGLTRAEQAGIATECVSHTGFATRADFDAALIATLSSYQPDLIVLAGFMRILTRRFIRHFVGRILNIHPSLLPKYPGLNTHQRAIDAGDDWHGSTVHFATEELDGGPCIIQGRVPVLADDSAASLAERVLEIEHRIYPEAAALFAAGRLEHVCGKVLLDGKQLNKPLQTD